MLRRAALSAVSDLCMGTALYLARLAVTLKRRAVGAARRERADAPTVLWVARGGRA